MDFVFNSDQARIRRVLGIFAIAWAGWVDGMPAVRPDVLVDEESTQAIIN